MGVKGDSFGEFLLESRDSLNGFFKNTNESAKSLLAQETKFWPSQLPPIAHIEVSMKELFIYTVVDLCLG